MVSAELALAIPTVVAVLVVGLGAVQVGVDRVRCVQAAGAAVRAVVRGESEAEVRSLAGRAAPPGAEISWGGGDVVEVVVTYRTRVLGLVELPAEVSGRAVGRVEAGGR